MKKKESKVEFILPHGITNQDPEDMNKFIAQYKKNGYLNNNRLQQLDTLFELMGNVNKWEGDMIGVFVQEMFRELAKDMVEGKYFSPFFDLAKKINEQVAKNNNLDTTISIVQLSKFFPYPEALPAHIMKKALKIVEEETSKRKGNVFRKPIIKEFTEGEKKYIVTIKSKFAYAVRESTSPESIADWRIIFPT